MKIAGFMPTTLLDYPEKLACTLFTAGCNFRCPFCQNGSLVMQTEEENHDPEEILAFLKKRRNILEGVCITGGEPTLQPDLPLFLSKIKELDYAIKLDTNGYCPEILSTLIKEKLIDYVAMDIKSSLKSYGPVCGLPDMNTDKIAQSVSLLQSGSTPYEFRTTLVKGLHTLADIEEISLWLSGAERYFLQSYEESDRILAKINHLDVPMTSFTKEELEEFLSAIRKHIPGACLRGIS